MKRALLVSLAAALLGSTSALASTPVTYPQFQASNEDSQRHVDYGVWSDLLHDFVLNVPIMDREPERRRSISTGSRVSSANESRYRYEANRIAYHLMSDEYKAAISDYRRDLEALPEQIDLASLPRDEQLAYWMNLHNVAVVEQVMLNYPFTYVNRQNAHGTRDDLFEAKILTVAGVPLSLNDIRIRIVYENWDDPRVIYGFFNGAIGGPELARDAFDGNQIWRQLDRNANEFVNSLRGVEVSRSALRVSHIYDEAAPYLFENFEADLRAHLRTYANEETAEQLAGNRPVRADVEEWHIADLINGSSRCTGPGGHTTMYSSAPEGNLGSRDAIPASCSSNLPTNALMLLNAVQERRIELLEEGRYGEVFTVDLPTVDPDERPADTADSQSSNDDR
ncbi:DUF547 domain-containing protein [Maricaulis parjimensis]|uniref:DUF547 domain-containing protein n=1 Tax=Maricaulis parjimensis TaxID=144023 RepID=UPI00193A3394|nr:DUF547 domain-containing protein [Maricaulis parjimensis]